MPSDVVKARYNGELRLLEVEFVVNYGEGKTIFVDHLNDLWARAVPEEWIARVLDHCREFPENTYVFQTKNPGRFRAFLRQMPPKTILGTTVETDLRHAVMGTVAPEPSERLAEVQGLREEGQTVFVTVEPILGFTDLFAQWLAWSGASWVNVGADSKGHGLPEPKKADLLLFLADLKACGVTVRQKPNLDRLL